MGRSQLIEFHDLPWFPAVWRDLLTDFLSFFATTFKPYIGVAPILAEALRCTGSGRIVDLCSGAGQPVLSLIPSLREEGVTDLEIVLTDKYPHAAAWNRLESIEGALVAFEPAPVDAIGVPDHLDGFRTLFTSFHHFAPEQAQRVLADAVGRGQGIGIFEYTERSFRRWAVPVCLIPLLVWICTPLIRPFSWRRLVWTYLLPVVPVVTLWDGFVSCLRSYSVEELQGLVEREGDGAYRWEIGRVPSSGFRRVTYLVGLPLLAVVARGHQDAGVTDQIESEGDRPEPS